MFSLFFVDFSLFFNDFFCFYYAAAMTPLAERPPLRDVQRARNDAIMNLAVEAIRKQQGSLNVWYV